MKPPQPPAVKSPQGAQTQMTVKDQQKRALLQPPPEEASDLLSTLPREAQVQLRQGYNQGGFEGITNAVGPEWYDIPEYERTKLLSQIRR